MQTIKQRLFLSALVLTFGICELDGLIAQQPAQQPADAFQNVEHEPAWVPLWKNALEQLNSKKIVEADLCYDLLAAVYRFDAPQDNKHASQLFFLQSVWRPVIDQAIDRKGKAGEDFIIAEVARIEKRLIDNSVPEAVAWFGRFCVVSFFYDQRGGIEKLKRSLEDEKLSQAASSPLLCETFKGHYLNQKGLLAIEESNFADAANFLNEALERRRNAPYADEFAESLNNLGLLSFKLGDFTAAQDFYKQAFEIFEKYPSPDGTSSIRKLTASANSIKATENSDGSLEFDIPIRKLTELITTLESPIKGASDKDRKKLESLCRNNLGIAYYSTGKFEEFESLAEQVLNDYSQVVGQEDIVIAESKVNLAWAKLANRKLDAAEQEFKSALALLQKFHPESHRIAEVQSYLARMFATHFSNDLKKLEESRELIQASMDERESYLTRTLGTKLSERNRLAFVQNLRLHPESIAWPGEFDTFLELASSIPGLNISVKDQYRRVLVWKGVLTRSSADAANHPGALKLEELQTAIPTGSALLDIVEYRVFQDRASNQVVDQRKYGGFIVTQDDVRLFDFGSSKNIDRAIRFIRSKFVKELPDFENESQKLNELFGQKLQAELGDIHTLIVCPDGKLHGLPWAALPDSLHAGQALVDRYQVNIVSSAHSLLKKPDSDSTISGWATVGGVDYGAGEPWKVLAASQTEADSIDQVLSSHFPSITIQPKLRGSAASKKALVDLLPVKSIVHVATHGQFQGDTAGSNSFSVYGVSSQLDSALIMANANNNQLDRSETRITAEEISGMKLDKLTLMVMSACETGLGHVVAGQELIGLTSSLESAGVRSTVASLWTVDDDATRILMEYFYRRLLGTPGELRVAEAMQHAQNELRKHEGGKYSHPYFWAAWIVVGNPEPAR